MAFPVSVSLGPRSLNLKFGNEALADALFELQQRVPSGMLGGLKLTLDQALRLLEAGDPHAIMTFLKHGSKFERRNLSDPQIFGWLDEYTDPNGPDGSLVELSEPIEKALSAGGHIVRKKETTHADGTKKVEIERPHLVTAPGE